MLKSGARRYGAGTWKSLAHETMRLMGRNTCVTCCITERRTIIEIQLVNENTLFAPRLTAHCVLTAQFHMLSDKYVRVLLK